MSALTSVSQLPAVRLEVRQGGRSVPYLFDQVDFLIGAVAGCDLRVPGADLPAVLCLLARHPDGVRLRRLAPTQVLLLNGQAVSRAELSDGDRVSIGAIDIFIRLDPPPPVDPGSDDDVIDADDVDYEKLQADLDERETALLTERARLAEATAAFQRERDAWEASRAVPIVSPRASIGGDGLERELALERREEEATRRSQQLDVQTAEIERQKQEIASARQELSVIRQQLYDRYQERRDRLSGLKESVDRAARKVQDAKREQEAECRAIAERMAELTRRDEEQSQLALQLESGRTQLEAEIQAWHDSQSDIRSDIETKLADLSAREERHASQRQTLEAREKLYQADVVRLDRRQGELEARERQIAEQSAELSAKQEQLRQDTEELETQAREFDAVRVQAEADMARLAIEKAESEARQAKLDERAAALEGQQAALATLRGKLERMRDEFRQHDQLLEAQRLAHEEIAQRNTARQQDLDRREAEIAALEAASTAEREQIATRQATLAAAVEQLKLAEERHLAEEHSLQAKSIELDARISAQAEQEAILRGRIEQLTDAQSRLDSERQTLRERTVELSRAEEARGVLQEQLRKRSEDLAAKQKELHDQIEAVRIQRTKLGEIDVELEAREKSLREDAERQRAVIAEETAALESRRASLAQLEAVQKRQVEELADRSRSVAEQERLLAEQQEQNQSLWNQQRETIRTEREQLDALRREVRDLIRELPDLELKAGAAVDQLAHAREQLRDHLGELHAFVQQSQDDLEATRARLRHEEDALARSQAEFRRQHDEHRHAVAAFRQETIDWQARLKDLERQLKKEDRGLEIRQGRMIDLARELEQTAQTLVGEQALLDSQKETVAETRQDVDRHVGDLRDWYRQKMRELAGGHEEAEMVDATAAMLEGEDAPLVPTERNILSITGPLDEAERTLASAIEKHQLLDAAAVHTLLVEARRQRRSLKSIAVASGALTAYQVALLETEQTEGLSVGPFRVIDRLRQTAYESVYRAFDPRRGREVLVRHLSEDAAQDAVLPDEFRQRFKQLMVPDAHVAGVVDVLDIAGRPAAVMEWLLGVPSGDWPPLVAAPGVCYRLFTQSAVALSVLHKNGLAHGRLRDNDLLLTSQGLLKICGANEPAWLHSGDEPPLDPAADDLRQLGQIVAGWCAPTAVRKGAKAKPLPERMLAIVARLQAGGYSTVRDVLDDLDQAGSDIPANPEAWDRLLRYVRDHAQPEMMMRKTA